jgi:hypothetical protein
MRIVTDNQTNKQTDKQTDKQTHKQTNKQTNKQTTNLHFTTLALEAGALVILGVPHMRPGDC